MDLDSSSCILFGIGAGREQHAKDSNHNRMRDGVFFIHVSFVKQLHFRNFRFFELEPRDFLKVPIVNEL